MKTIPSTTPTQPPSAGGAGYRASAISRMLRRMGMLPVPQTRDGVQVLQNGKGRVQIRVSVCDSESAEKRLAADVETALKQKGVSHERKENIFYIPSSLTASERFLAHWRNQQINPLWQQETREVIKMMLDEYQTSHAAPTLTPARPCAE